MSTPNSLLTGRIITKGKRPFLRIWYEGEQVGDLEIEEVEERVYELVNEGIIDISGLIVDYVIVNKKKEVILWCEGELTVDINDPEGNYEVDLDLNDEDQDDEEEEYDNDDDEDDD